MPQLPTDQHFKEFEKRSHKKWIGPDFDVAIFFNAHCYEINQNPKAKQPKIGILEKTQNLPKTMRCCILLRTLARVFLLGDVFIRWYAPCVSPRGVDYPRKIKSRQAWTSWDCYSIFHKLSSKMNSCLELINSNGI